MAAIQSRDQFPPAYSKRFTSFASDLDLDGASAPTGVNWLPCQVIIEHAQRSLHFGRRDVRPARIRVINLPHDRIVDAQLAANRAQHLAGGGTDVGKLGAAVLRVQGRGDGHGGQHGEREAEQGM